MRKLISLLLALVLALSCAAAAEQDDLTALEFDDFTLAIRKDAVGTGTDTIENNVPFLTVYQDYNPNAVLNNCLRIAWAEDVLDLAAVEPVAYCQAIAALAVQRYESTGVVVTEPRIYTAELDELDMRSAVSYVFSMHLDFSNLGLEYEETIYTFQAAAPIEGKGTYTFTITTDDLENSQQLLDVVDSVRWKD